MKPYTNPGQNSTKNRKWDTQQDHAGRYPAQFGAAGDPPDKTALCRPWFC